MSFLTFHEPRIQEESASFYEKATNQIDSVRHYSTRDINTGTNYSLAIYSFTPYANLQHPDTILNNLSTMWEDTDSLISTKQRTDLDYISVDMISKPKAIHTFRRARFSIYQDKMYELQAFLPEDELNSELNNRFFDHISFSERDNPIDLFSDKSELLLNDLASEEEETRKLAKQTLNYYDLGETTFERLDTAFQVKYPKEEEQYVKEILLWSMYTADSLKTFEYIQTHYSEWADTNGAQISALEILLNMQTPESIAYAKQLLLTEPPLTDGFSYYESDLLEGLASQDDSLQLAGSLFPEILQLLENEHYQLNVLRLITELDSQDRLKREHLIPHEAALLKRIETTIAIADTIDNEHKDASRIVGSMNGFITILVQFKDKNQSISLLQKITTLPYPSIQLNAAEALWNMNQTVSPKVLEDLAKKDSFRRLLFESMKEAEKMDAFLKAYKTQENMAKSILRAYLWGVGFF